MLHVVVSFFGSALRREIRLNPCIVTVEALKRCLPDQKCQLIVNGSTMKDASFLNDYSIVDGEIIVAFPSTSRAYGNNSSSNSNNNDNDNSSSSPAMVNPTSSEAQCYLEKMRIRSNPRLLCEEMRLRDIRFLRMSEKDEKRYLQIFQFQQKKTTTKWPTVLPPMSVDIGASMGAPSEDPLPYLF